MRGHVFPSLGGAGKRPASLERQRKEPDSVFEFYKKLICLRKTSTYQETLVYGRTEPVLEEEPGIMAYFRVGQGQRILVAGNFGQEAKRIRIAGMDWEKCQVLLSNDKVVDGNGDELLLQGLQVVVVEG